MSNSRFTIDRELLIRIFFFGTFAFLLYQLFLLAKPFLSAFLVAIMLAITFYPLYKWVRRRIKNPNVAALLVTVGVVLLAVLPLLGLSWYVIGEARNLIPAAQNVIGTLSSGDFSTLQQKLPEPMFAFFEKAAAYLNSINVDIKPILLDQAREWGGRITAFGGWAARNTIFILIKLLILILTLFFVIRDGEHFHNWVLNVIPMETSHKQAIAKSAYETFRAVSIGVFLTAAAQGFVAFLGFAIAGVRLPILLGLLTSLVSLLGASFIITLPVGLFMLMESSTKGIFLIIWGMTAVGWLDNFLKPILIGSRARMPFVLVFFSILGGLKMYGLLGLVLGPILVASVLTFIRIYREAYGS
jgi:predicted PurR-regulated permease PerM